jgi:hypothetical protein
MSGLKLRELKADVAKALHKSAEGCKTFDAYVHEYTVASSHPDVELLRSGDVSGGNKYFAGNPRREKALGLLRDEMRKLQRIREEVLVWLDDNNLRQERRELTECLDRIHERMAIAKETIKEHAEKAHGKRALERLDVEAPEDRARREALEWCVDAPQRAAADRSAHSPRQACSPCARAPAARPRVRRASAARVNVPVPCSLALAPPALTRNPTCAGAASAWRRFARRWTRSRPRPRRWAAAAPQSRRRPRARRATRPSSAATARTRPSSRFS